MYIPMSFDNTHGCETITTNKKQLFYTLKISAMPPLCI